jgi:hypothetical protein
MMFFYFMGLIGLIRLMGLIRLINLLYSSVDESADACGKDYPNRRYPEGADEQCRYDWYPYIITVDLGGLRHSEAWSCY